MNTLQAQTPRRWPSPKFLSEPAHPGKPYAHELPKYMAYLRYQLKRGVCGQWNFQKHLHLSPSVLEEWSVEILRFMAGRGPVTASEVVEAFAEVDKRSIHNRLRGFCRRGYAVNLTEPPHIGLYQITSKGLQATGGTQNAG